MESGIDLKCTAELRLSPKGLIFPKKTVPNNQALQKDPLIIARVVEVGDRSIGHRAEPGESIALVFDMMVGAFVFILYNSSHGEILTQIANNSPHAICREHHGQNPCLLLAGEGIAAVAAQIGQYHYLPAQGMNMNIQFEIDRENLNLAKRIMQC